MKLVKFQRKTMRIHYHNNVNMKYEVLSLVIFISS